MFINIINGHLIFLQEFLKKEYSQENIVFWCLCEKYKKIKSDNVVSMQ